MKEVVFVRKNISKWRKAYEMADSISKATPDQIAETYLEVSADLAFARTHYPDSEVVPLLNTLSLRIHNHIYGYRPQRLRRIISFWMEEIPSVIYRYRRLMLTSLCLFVAFVVLGWLSTMADSSFARTIMGDRYIEMTLSNIEKGEPMGVYGSDHSHRMMLDITLNNIFVSLYTYAYGIMSYFIPGLVLARNGVMLGSFMTFCSQQGVLSECLLAMWLHGVLEITAIIVSGGAGLILGCGWLFPGSLPRMTSFRLAAKSSVKVIVGLIPVFIVAGFIESYITRHTHAPLVMRLGLIIVSLAIVLFYFIYLPYRQSHAED